MRMALYLIALVALVVGLGLRIVARKHLTELGRSIPWYSLAFWRYPPWRASENLTPRGMEIHFTSVALMMGGVAAYLIAQAFY